MSIYTYYLLLTVDDKKLPLHSRPLFMVKNTKHTQVE